MLFNKVWLTIIGTILAIIVVFLLIRFISSPEDDWIKNKTGEYIKHGNPTGIPDDVAAQQQAIICASSLYQQKKQAGMNFSSQCLGSCGDYAIDIVHVPRTSEDNLPENQCSDYTSGKVKHFIELDANGQIVRVV
jgi:hypothetical protein